MFGPLKAVAVPTGQGEVRGDSAAAVLAGDDVIDLERKGRCRPWKAAIFAATGGMLANLLGRSRGHAVSAPTGFS